MTLDLFLISAGIAFNPFSLSAFFVLLPSKRGVVKGAGFVFGWLISLAIVVAATLLATQNHPPKPDTAPSLAALAAKAAIGAALVIIALRRRRGAGKPKTPKPPPKWHAQVDNMSPLYAVALGALVQPWGLVGAGVATVVDMHVSTAASYLTLLAFCVLSSSSYIAIELYMASRPEQSTALLDRIQSWMKRHTDQVIIIGSLTLGFYLIGHSTYLILTA